MKIYPIIFIIFLFIISCSTEQEKTLKLADSVMENHPDSAMSLLESIDRSNLKDSEQPYYALLYTQAQIKTDVPLDSDSLISIALSKYGRDTRGDRGLRSNYYTGEVLFNQNKNPQAMRYYLTVYEDSKHLENEYWQAKAAERISDLLYFAYNYDEAERYAIEAAQLYKIINRKIFHRYTLGKLADILINNGEADKAYILLDSLHNVVINESPVDSGFIEYIKKPLIYTLVQGGRLNEIATYKMELTDNDKYDEELVNTAILQGEILDSMGKTDETTKILIAAQDFCQTEEDRVHILYARYNNAKEIGNNALALSLVDSLLFYQNQLAENIIRESIIGAQRDFYVDRERWHKKQSSFFKTTLIIASIGFLLLLAFIIVLAIYKNKAQEANLKANLESLISLKSHSESVMHDKAEKLHAMLEDKDLELRRIQNLMQEKDIEYIQIKNDLKKRNDEYGNMQLLLSEKSEKEITQARIVEKLFKEKWMTLDMLCNQYFSLNNFELSEKSILSNIEKEVKRIISKKGIAEIVETADIYMDGIVTELKKQCTFLKEDDINYIALSYAGFSARSVCLFTGIKYKHYYVKKARLIERIRKSDAPDKDLFISKMK
ncbi:MAG: hypothetical protein K2L17_01065 [Muribaculaceae bacterium]|nr:hypothetical protein [Muribaculaceae bacterium]